MAKCHMKHGMMQPGATMALMDKGIETDIFSETMNRTPKTLSGSHLLRRQTSINAGTVDELFVYLASEVEHKQGN